MDFANIQYLCVEQRKREGKTKQLNSAFSEFKNTYNMLLDPVEGE